jgi:AraC-like DNA-binding protein
MERSQDAAISAVVEHFRQDAVPVSFFERRQRIRPANGDLARPLGGRSRVELYDYRGAGSTSLRANRDRVLFLCNGDEKAKLVGTRGSLTVEPHSWTYLGNGPVHLTTSSGAYCVVAVQKAALQAIASAKTGAARKVADAVLVLPAMPPDVLAMVTAAPFAQEPPCENGENLADLIQVLACAMLATQSLDFIFPIARGINRAMCYISEHLTEPCTPERLARVVGVTPRTVREGFHSYLGTSVANYVRQARLSWARKQLESGRESRSMRELALFLGFQDSPAFSRAYQSWFGESPTATRARAARSIC